MLRPLLSILAAACLIVSVAGHECIHGSPRLQQLLASEIRRSPRLHLTSDRRLQAQQGNSSTTTTTTQRLRIVPSFADLDTDGQYCAAAGDVRPDFAGGRMTCEAADVLTPQKRTALTAVVIPRALEQLAAALSLVPVADPILVPAGSCNGFTVPASHMNAGVADADFVLYVAAGPTASRSTLAWAGACRLDTAGRPVVGRANFNPRFLDFDSADAAAVTEQVETAVHELIHALGFSESVFAELMVNATLRGKAVRGLRGTPTAIAAVRDFLGCSAVDLVELEDEGGVGTAGSHLERRIFKDELMTAAGGTAMSAVSLGVLADVGGYVPTPSAAQPMAFGRGAGCNFAHFACNTTGGGRNKWWCFEADRTVSMCTADGLAVGYCATQVRTSPVPAAFQYFPDPLMAGLQYADACPVVQPFSNKQCTTYRAQTSSDVVLGETFGASSRCFETDGLTRSGYSTTGASRHRCLEHRCTASRTLLVRVGDSAWRFCTYAGERVTDVSGFEGAVICPDPVGVCGSASVGTGDTTPASNASEVLVPRPTTPPSDFVPRIQGTAVIAGAGFQRLSGPEFAAVADGLALDIGRVFALDAASVRSSPASSTTVEATLRFTIGNVPLSEDAATVGLQRMVQAGGSIPNAASAYGAAASSPTDTPRLTAATVDRNDVGLCSDVTNIPADMCLVYVGVGVVALALVICIVCVIVRAVVKANEPPPEPNMVMVGPSDLDVPKQRRGVRAARSNRYKV